MKSVVNDAPDSARPLSTPTPAGENMLGKGWSRAIGLGWLVLFAIITALRWTGGSGASGMEKIVQHSVPADANGAPGKEVTAPDPGDNP